MDGKVRANFEHKVFSANVSLFLQHRFMSVFGVLERMIKYTLLMFNSSFAISLRFNHTLTGLIVKAWKHYPDRVIFHDESEFERYTGCCYGENIWLIVAMMKTFD